MRKIAWVTVVSTFILMVWGNFVSATGSGLACPDWPLCHGTITPPARLDIMWEWGHRIIASITTCFILLTAFQAWKLSRKSDDLGRVTKRLMILVLGLLGILAAQITLGAVTVMLELSVAISTIHLMTATAILSGLLLVASVVTWPEEMVVGTPKMKRLALVALAGLLVQFVLGALVRHTHSGLACPNFPNCHSELLPVPFMFETLIAFSHRWWGILLLGVLVHIGLEGRRVANSGLKILAFTVVGISLIQVLLGILTVMGALDTATRGIHAAVGYGLWLCVFLVAVRSGAFQSLWSIQKGRTA